MKREKLEKLLLETAEDEPGVSGRLHQDVMRAVNTSLTALEDQLAALSQHTLIPDKELKAEPERLKSDLKRFDFRS
jgi:hypothetical protein